MILITGATGQLGSAVIQHLLTKIPASQIAAFVRDAGKAAGLQEKGVSIRVGTYDDTAALDNAMQGIEKVLLISGGDADNALQQHQNAVDAAKKAGVKGIAYTGRSLKDPSTLVNKLMNRHFQTEDYIKESGLNYALFRNILYMDVLPLFVGKQVFDTGIHLPAGDGKVSFALRGEMGEAMAKVLLDSDCDNQTYNFTGSETYSFEDVANALSELSGKEVKYSAVTPAEFEAQMKGRGIPDFMVPRMIGFITDIKNGQETTLSPDLENKLGRKPVSLKEGLKTLFHV
jgi:NAD(P)H dehydrogenase (quinone)